MDEFWEEALSRHRTSFSAPKISAPTEQSALYNGPVSHTGLVCVFRIEADIKALDWLCAYRMGTEIWAEGDVSIGNDKDSAEGPQGSSEDAAALSETGQLHEEVIDARSAFISRVEDVPDFGVLQLSLLEAANLIAADMWLQDEERPDLPDIDEMEALSPRDPRLLRALQSQRLVLCRRLIDSAANGSLACSKVALDLMSGDLDPERTYVHFRSLSAWLARHEYPAGEYIQEYEEAEAGIIDAVASALFDIRNIRESAFEIHDPEPGCHPWISEALGDGDERESETQESLRNALRAYAAQVRVLKQQLSEQNTSRTADRLNPKGRNTLYRIILGLAKQAKIDLNAREAVSKVVRLTEDAGVAVRDDTVRTVLRDVSAICPD